MKLVAEIISELKIRMVRSHRAMRKSLDEIASMKATLDKMEKRIKRQYRKDSKYLSRIVCEDGTNTD